VACSQRCQANNQCSTKNPKTPKPQQQQQQPVQTPAAMPAVIAVQPIKPTPAVQQCQTLCQSTPLLKQPCVQRNLSNAAGQKNLSVLK